MIRLLLTFLIFLILLTILFKMFKLLNYLLKPFFKKIWYFFLFILMYIYFIFIYISFKIKYFLYYLFHPKNKKFYYYLKLNENKIIDYLIQNEVKIIDEYDTYKIIISNKKWMLNFINSKFEDKKNIIFNVSKKHIEKIENCNIFWKYFFLLFSWEYDKINFLFEEKDLVIKTFLYKLIFEIFKRKLFKKEDIEKKEEKSTINNRNNIKIEKLYETIEKIEELKLKKEKKNNSVEFLNWIKNNLEKVHSLK